MFYTQFFFCASGVEKIWLYCIVVVVVTGVCYKNVFILRVRRDNFIIISAFTSPFFLILCVCINSGFDEAEGGFDGGRKIANVFNKLI